MEQQRGKAGFGRKVDDKMLSPNRPRTALGVTGQRQGSDWLVQSRGSLRRNDYSKTGHRKWELSPKLSLVVGISGYRKTGRQLEVKPEKKTESPAHTEVVAKIEGG